MPDLAPVYDELRAILARHAAALEVTRDDDEQLSLDTAHVMKNGSPLFFGAVQVKKRYVSFHLMPVYVKPELLDGISPKLRKRMQGKSCFNFTKVDPELFAELASLTDAGFTSYREQGFM